MNRESKRYAIVTSLLSFLLGLALLGFVSEVEVNYPKLASVMRLLGSFLTVSVVVSLLYSYFIKPSDDAARKDELKELLNEKVDGILVDKGKYGLSGFLDSMDFENLFDNLQHNQTLWWLDTYPLGVGGWTENLKQALERGANINMLVLDSCSDNVSHRANELGSDYNPDKFKNEIERFLGLLKDICKHEFAGKLEIRTYDELIGLPLYIVEEANQPIVGYSGFFLSDPTAVRVPHLKWVMSEQSILCSMTSYIREKWVRNESNTLS